MTLWHHKAYYRLMYTSTQVNREYRQGVRRGTEHNLQKFSTNLNVLRANHRNSIELHGLEYDHNARLPDYTYTIDKIVALFIQCFGSTKEEHLREETFSRLAQCNIDINSIGWVQMLDSREKLKDYVKDVIAKGDLYEVPPSFSKHVVVDVDAVPNVMEEGNELLDEGEGEDELLNGKSC